MPTRTSVYFSLNDQYFRAHHLRLCLPCRTWLEKRQAIPTKRLKRKAKKFIAAKARLQYGEEVKEVSIPVQESGNKKR